MTPSPSPTATTGTGDLSRVVTCALVTASVAFAIASLFFFLNEVPGLNGDEAWIGLRAHAIAEGDNPRCGLQFYIGPLHYYLLVPFLRLFGYTVSALRMLTAVMGVASVWLYFVVVRRLFHERVAAVAVLILVSFPFFTIYGRIATEHFALSPALALLSVYFSLRAYATTGRSRYAWGFLASLAVALGVWNHLIFLPVPFLIVALAMLTMKQGSQRSLIIWSVVVGGFIGLLPHVGCVNTVHHPLSSSGLTLFYSVFAGFFSRMVEWPALFLRLIQGDLLYVRYTGEVAFPVSFFGLFFILAAIITIARVFTGERSTRMGSRNVWISFVLFFLATLLVSPGNSDRYFLLPLYFVPLVLALCFTELLRERRWSKYIWVVVVLMVMFNSARTLKNYFGVMRSSGGNVAHFSMGSMPETTHAVRTDGLYADLVAMGAKHIVTEFMIGMPLKFYDIEGRHFDAVEVRHEFPRGVENRLAPGVFVVAYNDPQHRAVMSRYKELKLVREERNFLIYTVVQAD